MFRKRMLSVLATVFVSLFVYGICFGEESVAKVEDKIVQEIKAFGVKDRFLIKEFKPVKEQHQGFTTSPLPSRITTVASDKGDITYREEFPEDKLVTSVIAGMGKPTKSGEYSSFKIEKIDRSGWGEDSIHRFDGRVVLPGSYTFIDEGDKLNRLTFVVLEQGYVYVRGKGKVILPNGKEVKLGY